EVLLARTKALLNRGEVRGFSGHAIAGRSELASCWSPLGLQRPRHGIVVRDVSPYGQAPVAGVTSRASATNRCGVATGRDRPSIADLEHHGSVGGYGATAGVQPDSCRGA